ncbi:MAG: phosphatase PAP2 family protein [Lachnotalea sp.]
MNFQILIKKYKHAFTLLYVLIYVPWFMYLEKHVVKGYHIIHMNIDDKIPFIEMFIVPYLLWFAYVAITLMYFFFFDVNSYKRMCLFLFSGMTIFLIISTIYPNGHQLRPVVFTRNNMFTHMVKALYSADTPTNLFPSIHVFNSLGTHLAIIKSEKLKDKKWLHISSFILMFFIIMSTLFLKQHSMFDVLTAFVMAGGFYSLVYRSELIYNIGKKQEYQESTY